MQASSDCIWPTITNNNQPLHRTTNEPVIGNPPARNRDNKPSVHYDSLSKIPTGRPLNGPRNQLVDGYTQLVTERIRNGWSCHLLTFLFPQLPGPRTAVINQMKDQLQRVYSMFVTRVHRKPRTADIDELPILISAADLPVHKHNRSSAPAVTCNGGLHFHAIILIPRTSRLKESLADHFSRYQSMYTRSGNLIQHIHVRPVVENYGRVIDYVLKTISKGRVGYDEGVLVLPRVKAEL